MSLPPDHLDIFSDLRYCGFKMIAHIIFYRLIQLNTELPNKCRLSWLLFQITIINRDIIFLIQRLINRQDDPNYEKIIRKLIIRKLWTADGTERPIAVMRRLSLMELQAFVFARDDQIYGIGLDINGNVEPFSPLDMLQRSSMHSGLIDIRREYERIVRNAIDFIYTDNARLTGLDSDDAEADLRPILFVEHIVIMEPFKEQVHPPRDQKRKWRDAKDSEKNGIDRPTEKKKRRLIDGRPMLKRCVMNE